MLQYELLNMYYVRYHHELHFPGQRDDYYLQKPRDDQFPSHKINDKYWPPNLKGQTSIFNVYFVD